MCETATKPFEICEKCNAKKILHFRRKLFESFVIFFEKLLDNLGKGCYIILARVWNHYACTAMMQEIASKDGNFCGVCPVIGRLNCFVASAYIAALTENGSASVGHFSWLRMIRTATRTNSSTVPSHYAN